MDVEVTKGEGHSEVRVKGEVDLATAPGLHESLEGFEPADGPLIVDLSDVAFLDSSGLSVLVRCHQHLDADGGGLRLVVTRPTILRVLDATGLAEVLDVYATLEDARRGL